MADEHPSHVCDDWLGRSEKMADAFYGQVTDNHFTRVTAQNAAQKAHETGGNERKQKSEEASQPATASGDSEDIPVGSGYFTESKVGGAGFEPA